MASPRPPKTSLCHVPPLIGRQEEKKAKCGLVHFRKISSKVVIVLEILYPSQWSVGSFQTDDGSLFAQKDTHNIFHMGECVTVKFYGVIFMV